MSDRETEKMNQDLQHDINDLRSENEVLKKKLNSQENQINLIGCAITINLPAYTKWEDGSGSIFYTKITKDYVRNIEINVSKQKSNFYFAPLFPKSELTLEGMFDSGYFSRKIASCESEYERAKELLFKSTGVNDED